MPGAEVATSIDWTATGTVIAAIASVAAAVAAWRSAAVSAKSVRITEAATQRATLVARVERTHRQGTLPEYWIVVENRGPATAMAVTALFVGEQAQARPGDEQSVITIGDMSKPAVQATVIAMPVGGTIQRRAIGPMFDHDGDGVFVKLEWRDGRPEKQVDAFDLEL